jgi:hypothetical protein
LFNIVFVYMAEGQPTPNHSEGGYPQPPFSSFAENLQRRYANLVDNGQQSTNTPAEDMTRLLARMDYDAGLTYNTEVQELAQNLKWAFIALTYPHYSPVFQTEYIRQYNQFQRKQQEQGASTTGIKVSGEQTQLLAWMLDHIGVTHDFQTGDMHIPFAPMETRMQEIAQENSAHSSQRSVIDHEATTGVADLMEAWQKTQEGNGQP